MKIDLLPNYKLLTCLNETNYQSVFRARSEVTNDNVILKVVNKETSEIDSLNQLRNECDLLTQFSAIEGIPQVIDFIDTGACLILIIEDFGGVPLTELMAAESLSVAKIVDIVSQCAQILEVLHKHNIIHKDVKPANIIWNSASEKVQLIDFGLSVQFNHSSNNFYQFGSMDGSLCYMPPEQTGRVNRLVDYRSDCYALGMTAYELLCKEKPFSSATNSDEILYAILAIQPVAPHQLNELVPMSLSNIVMRLISKDAESRYQTHQGLLYDLSKCLIQTDLRLGQQDICSEFQSPKKVYGRKKELSLLAKSLKNVFAGQSERVFISGFSGVGKTTVVRELFADIQKANGVVIEGKFDLLQRDQPLYALTQAFDEFFAAILIESDKQVAHWQKTLTEQLGENLNVVSQLIPNLQYLVGQTSEPIYLAGEEGLNRLIFAFLNLIKLMASKEKPLVIFIDDLQWMDMASEKLINALFASDDIKYVMFIACYRDNEIDEHHVVNDLINSQQSTHWRSQVIKLHNLTDEAVQAFIEDGFQKRIDNIHLLTQFLFKKTAGNPFFTIQLIENLIESGLIKQNANHQWQYQLSELDKVAVADSVVSLMVGKLASLPPEQRQFLQMAAAIGHEFSLDTLALITNKTSGELLQSLLPAIHSGFVMAAESSFVFAHDGIQQAAYEMGSEQQTKQMHLTIAQHLLTEHEENQNGNRKGLFDVCFHFNHCFDLIESAATRLHIIQLNLQAVMAARHSAAYRTSFNYILAVFKLLEEWNLTLDDALVFSTYKQAAESAYLCGEYDLANGYFEQAEKAAKTKYQTCQVVNLRVVQQVSLGQYSESMLSGISVLKQYGIALPDATEQDEIEHAYLVKQSQFEQDWTAQNKSIEQLFELPVNEDPEINLLMELLGSLYASALMSFPNYLKVITIELVNLSVKHGNTLTSPIAYAWHGSTITAISEQYDDGYAFGQLAIKLNENKIKNPAISCKIYNMVGNFINFFKEPIRDILPTLRHAYSLGMESGDKLYGGYSIINELRNALSTGMPINKWLALDDDIKHKLEQCNADLMVEVRESFRSYALQLAGQSHSLNNLDNDVFSEQDYRDKYAQVPLFGCLLDAWKIQSCFHLAKYDEALTLSYADSSPIDSFVLGVEKHFFSALTFIQCQSSQNSNAKVSEQQRIIQQDFIAQSLHRIGVQAQSCPQNFLHLSLILQGAKAAQEQQTAKALKFFNQAIHSAKVNNFLQYQALANELAATLCIQQGMNESGNIHLEQAYKLYSAWGAMAKLEQLKLAYPEVKFYQSERSSSGSQSGYIDKTTIANRIDLKSIMDTSLALSSEIEVDALISRLMKVVVEGSGAERAMLLLKGRRQWSVAAEYSGSHQYNYYAPEEYTKPEGKLPLSVLKYVVRTGKTLHLTDAMNTSPYNSDVYVQSQNAKSVICLPLRHQNKTRAILYIENNLAKNSFTQEQFQRLTLLSSQMASAIDNSFNYQSLADSEQHYRSLLKNLPIATIVQHQDRVIHYANEHAHQLLNLVTLDGQKELCYSLEGELFDDLGNALAMDPIDQVFETKTPLINKITGFKSTGAESIRWFMLSAFPQYSHNKLTSVLTCLMDISERREHEAKIEHLAYFDSLTGLPNRVSLEPRLKQELTKTIEQQGCCAVLMLDLDHFKLINDTLGHWVGDEVLKQVAMNLQDAVNPDDFIARLGGDEFIVVTPTANVAVEVMRARVEKIATRIKTQFARKFEVNGRQLNSTASIGAVIVPMDADNADEVLRRVDSALYQSKQGGRNTLSFFSFEKENETQRRFELQDSILAGVEQQQFHLVYQPKVEVQSSKVIGVEALVRWQHPEHGFISPLEFISIAEESGSIIPLGAWILTKACQQAKLWCQAKGFEHLARVSVNVSSVQFNDEGFIQVVEHALASSGLSADKLDIEITESLFLANTEATIKKMQCLKTLGVSFSIDDFGTGYSSLEYLKRLPVDTIKIDQSFVREMNSDQDDKAIVETIIAIAKTLRLNIVAEGVESLEHLQMLKHLACDEYQGYYFSKPLTPTELETLLSSL